MSDQFTYRTIAANGYAELKEKGSKFLAYAYPVQDEVDIKLHLSELREKYSDATHHCYAWILGLEGESYRANDDGEPGNSAGQPIYRQIVSAELTNILVVVVRYYGGTKLGVPGLIQSYGAAAKYALESVEPIEKELQVTAIVKGQTGEEHMVFVTVNKLGGSVEVIEMTSRFTLKCTMPKSRADEFMTTAKMWHKFEVEISE